MSLAIKTVGICALAQTKFGGKPNAHMTDSRLLSTAATWSHLALAAFFLILSQWFGLRFTDSDAACSSSDNAGSCGFIYLSLVWCALIWFGQWVLVHGFSMLGSHVKFAVRTLGVLFGMACFFSAMAVIALVGAPEDVNHMDATHSLALASGVIALLTTIVLLVVGFCLQ